MLPGMDGLLVCQAMRADPAIGGDPDHHAHGARRGSRPRVRARARRRRLRHQAVQPERAHARASTALLRRAGAHQRRRAAALRADHDRSGPAHGHARRRGGAADRQGVPAAAVPRAAQRPRAVARPAAQRRLGLPLHRRHAHGRRARPAPAREAAVLSRRASRPSSSSATSSPTARDLPHAPLPHVARRGGADAARRDDARLVVGAPDAWTSASNARSSARRGWRPRRCRTAGRGRRRARRRGRRARRAGRRARHASSRPTASWSATPSSTARRSRTVENHGDRPEIQQARRDGLGVARRYSTTRQRRHAVRRRAGHQRRRCRRSAFVRLALPLTDVAEQLAAVRRIALVAFGVGLARRPRPRVDDRRCSLSRRVRAIAAVAERYAAGDLSRPARDYGTDEIGTVARVLDDSAREIGRRATDLASDRARMEAILGGMIEGVLVVNEHGRVQLVNDAARAMLRLQDASGRPPLRRDRPAARHRRAARRRRSAATPTEGLELTLPREPELIIIARSAPVASAGRRAAPCSSCTTSPTCAAPTASAATSSPTSRTSCARR